tara:strand:- start:219 stop:626 length:408 start_codon:yes stop_codon:yes gene_type:complete
VHLDRSDERTRGVVHGRTGRRPKHRDQHRPFVVDQELSQRPAARANDSDASAKRRVKLRFLFKAARRALREADEDARDLTRRCDPERTRLTQRQQDVGWDMTKDRTRVDGAIKRPAAAAAAAAAAASAVAAFARA